LRRPKDLKELDLAYCGLRCSRCPVLIATATDDDVLRQKTAKEWSHIFADILKTVGIDSLRPEDLNCRGCRSDRGHFFGCAKCFIRLCCREKRLKTCAHCDGYESCEVLRGFYSFAIHRPAKDNLDKIQNEKSHSAKAF
jgi:hypothetical protein